MERTGQEREHGKKRKEDGKYVMARPTELVSGIRHPVSLRKDLFGSEERKESPPGPLLLLDHQLELWISGCTSYLPVD